MVHYDLFKYHKQIIDELFKGTDLLIIGFNNIPERMAMEYEIFCVFFPEISNNKIPMYIMCVHNKYAYIIDHNINKILYKKYVGPY